MQSFGSFLCYVKGNQTAESGIVFFLDLIYKSAKICFYCECTQIKANLLQLQLSSWLNGVVASTVRRKKVSSDCSSTACEHTVKLSTLTIQPVHYHSKKHMGKKHTAQFKYTCSKICAVKHYHHTAVKLCKTFCFTWILEREWSRPT